MNRAEMRARDVVQAEQIGRRTSIIAERRDTRAPELERNQDIRSGRRGDVGGAENLLRTLGLVENAGSDIVGYMQNANADRERDNIAKGALDAANGTVDEAMMEKSLGYRNSVTKGRTVTNYTKARREFENELREVINGQTSASLEERIAEANELTENFFTNFATDPETGQFRDYLQSPGAMRYLAEEIQSTRPAVQSAAQQMIETRFKAEAFSHFNQNITDQVLETGTVDLTVARALLPGIVTEQEVAENAILAITNAANALRDRGDAQSVAQAAGLIAGLKRRSRAPMDPGVGTSDPTGTPASGNINATGTAGRFAAAFKEVGLSDAVIAGFLGNLQHESGFDSSRVGDKGTAFGHAQWREDRVENFKRVVGVHPRNASPEQSVQFIKWELDNYQAAGMTKRQRDAILNAETPEEAARAIDRFYERSDQKSTRDRMKAAREFFGTAPAAAPATEAAGPAPRLRLTDPFADPITQLERSGEFFDIVGIEDVQFSPEQVSRIDAYYDSYSNELRREYRARKAEEHSVNASRLALGLSGFGGAVTTNEDIVRAFENDEISPQDAMQLADIIQRNLDRRAAEAEREESRAEREERQRVEEAVTGGSEVILGRLAAGKVTAAQARTAALEVSRDPRLSVEARTGILATVMSVTNSYESAIENSEAVRNQQADFAEKASDPFSSLKMLAPNAPDARINAASAQYTELASRASGRMMSMIQKGEDPEVAAAKARTWLKNQTSILVSRLTVGGGAGPNTGR